MSKIVISGKKLHLEADTETGKIAGYQVNGFLCSASKLEFEYEISKLTFCHSRKTVLGKKVIAFGYDSNQFLCFKESAEAVQPLEDLILQSATKMNALGSFSNISRGFFSDDCLWANNDTVIHLNMKCCNYELEHVTCEEVAFFNIQKGIFKKPKLYFGYINQIACKAPDSEFSNRLLEHVKKNDAKIGKQVGEVYKDSSVFSFTHETIAFNDEAIIYNQTKLCSSDTMYIPFDKIGLVYASSGMLSKHLTIVGEMHVVTKKKFRNAVLKQLLEELKKAGVSVSVEGESFKTSRLWFRWLAFWRKDATLTIGEKNLFISPGKWGGVYKGAPINDPILMKNYLDENATEEELLEDDSRDKELVMVSKGAVVEAKFKKKSCFSIFGTLMIDYNMGASIRKDQNEAVTYGRIVIGRIRSPRASDAISLIESK